MGDARYVGRLPVRFLIHYDQRDARCVSRHGLPKEAPSGRIREQDRREGGNGCLRRHSQSSSITDCSAAARAKRDLGAPGRAPLRRPELGPQAGSQCPALGHWARSRSRSTEVPRRSLPRSWMDRISPFARERVAVPSKSRPLSRPVAARGGSANRTLCSAVCWMRPFRDTPAKNFGE